MGRPSLILAALAADAAPGRTFRSYRRVETNPDLDQLQLWDQEDHSYQLLIPATGAGEAELAGELQAIDVISDFVQDLEIDSPEILGQTKDPDGTTAVLLTLIGGQTPDLARFTPGEFSKSFAQAVASIHKLNPDIIREAGLPEYDADSVLKSKVAEIDRIAQTGRVPAQLLSRWEAATEDLGLFRFHPTVVHGGLNQDTVMVTGQKITGIASWSTLQISDPAEDLRWLTGGALRTTLEDTLIHYRALRENADENVGQRAQLYSELELGSWLAHCVEIQDEKAIAQAEDMISELRDQLESGNLRSLRAASFAGINTVATAHKKPAASMEAAETAEISQVAEAEDTKADEELF